MVQSLFIVRAVTESLPFIVIKGRWIGEAETEGIL